MRLLNNSLAAGTLRGPPSARPGKTISRCLLLSSAGGSWPLLAGGVNVVNSPIPFASCIKISSGNRPPASGGAHQSRGRARVKVYQTRRNLRECLSLSLSLSLSRSPAGVSRYIYARDGAKLARGRVKCHCDSLPLCQLQAGTTAEAIAVDGHHFTAAARRPNEDEETEIGRRDERRRRRVRRVRERARCRYENPLAFPAMAVASRRHFIEARVCSRKMLCRAPARRIPLFKDALRSGDWNLLPYH